MPHRMAVGVVLLEQHLLGVVAGTLIFGEAHCPFGLPRLVVPVRPPQPGQGSPAEYCSRVSDEISHLTASWILSRSFCALSAFLVSSTGASRSLAVRIPSAPQCIDANPLRSEFQPPELQRAGRVPCRYSRRSEPSTEILVQRNGTNPQPPPATVRQTGASLKIGRGAKTQNAGASGPT